LGVSTLTASIIIYVAITAISMAISFGISYLMRPGKQADRSAAPADQPTSLNTLAPPRNTMRPMSRVPDIYGKMRHWPDLIFNGTGRWEIVNANYTPLFEDKTATATQTVRAVYCVGRGSYDMNTFQFGDADIATQSGTVQIYPPGVTLPEDIKLPVLVSNISRIELGPLDSGTMWTSWYEIPSDEVSEIDVQIAWPSGMAAFVTGQKSLPPENVVPAFATISCQLERLDTDGTVLETGTQDFPVWYATQNELRQTFSLTGLTVGRWRIRVADIEPVHNYATGKNVQDTRKRGYLEDLVGFVVLDEDQRTYEHETVVVVTCSNTGGVAGQNLEAFNLIATRILPAPTFDLFGNFGPPVPHRFWYSAAVHTLMDPWLCNYKASEIDWQSLKDVHDSLQALSPTEENFNGIFDRQTSADDQVQLIAKKARAMAFMSNGRVTFARDQRRTGVSALFNRRNRLADRGSIGLGLRLPGPDDFDGVEITWFDEFDNFRQKVHSYPPGVTLINPLAIDLVGATTFPEVCRRARFEYQAQRYRRRSQPLRVTEEAQLLLPYDRVSVVAPWDEGVIDGEVLEVDGDDYRLDRPIPAPGTDLTDYRIRLRRSDGRETSLHSFTSSVRGEDWVTMSTVPTFPIVVPGSDKQSGTLYNVSSHDNVDAATQWIVTGAEIDDNGVTLTLLEDSDEVYQLSDDLTDPCETEPPVDDTCVTFSDNIVQDVPWTSVGLPVLVGRFPSGAAGGRFWADNPTLPVLDIVEGNLEDDEVTIDTKDYGGWAYSNYAFGVNKTYMALGYQGTSITTEAGDVAVVIQGDWFTPTDEGTELGVSRVNDRWNYTSTLEFENWPNTPMEAIVTQYFLATDDLTIPNPSESIGSTYTLPAGVRVMGVQRYHVRTVSAGFVSSPGEQVWFEAMPIAADGTSLGSWVTYGSTGLSLYWTFGPRLNFTTTPADEPLSEDGGAWVPKRMVAVIEARFWNDAYNSDAFMNSIRIEPIFTQTCESAVCLPSYTNNPYADEATSPLVIGKSPATTNGRFWFYNLDRPIQSLHNAHLLTSPLVIDGVEYTGEQNYGYGGSKITYINWINAKANAAGPLAGDMAVLLPGKWQPLRDKKTSTFFDPSTAYWQFLNNIQNEVFIFQEFEIVTKMYLLGSDSPTQPPHPMNSISGDYYLPPNVRVIHDSKNWRGRGVYNAGGGGWAVTEWMRVDENGDSLGAWVPYTSMTTEERPHQNIVVVPTGTPGSATDPWMPRYVMPVLELKFVTIAAGSTTRRITGLWPDYQSFCSGVSAPANNAPVIAIDVGDRTASYSVPGTLSPSTPKDIAVTDIQDDPVTFEVILFGVQVDETPVTQATFPMNIAALRNMMTFSPTVTGTAAGAVGQWSFNPGAETFSALSIYAGDPVTLHYTIMGNDGRLNSNEIELVVTLLP